jgi:3-dehydroquinate synthase
MTPHSTTVESDRAKIQVSLGDRSYNIEIGQNVFDEVCVYLTHAPTSKIVLVTNSMLSVLFGVKISKLQEELGSRLVIISLPDGEQFKTADSIDLIYSAMLKARCDRKTLVVAFGGGVVGDMAGFAAATYMRGVPFIQVPTTLLAQVDSSVGGKTGINHTLGKNMIGAFHQPLGVFVDTDFLATLPDRELRAGLAEVIKHALIADRYMVDWLLDHMTALLQRNPHDLARIVAHSCQVKASVVSADETEQGRRAILNFGHTFGHGLEAVLGFGTWLHGEAVGCGMCIAARLSHMQGYLDAREVLLVDQLVQSAGLPIRVPAMAATDKLIEAMLHDKKNENGRVVFVLLSPLGSARVEPVDLESARRAIDLCR